MRARTAITAIAAGLLAGAGLASAAAAAPARTPAPSSQQHLRSAMHGEAFAFAAYSAFAAQAERTGHQPIARQFRSTGLQERDEHFVEEADLLGLVGTAAANLEATISDEAKEATETYLAYARQARAERNGAAADLFSELADDEGQHQMLLQRALRALGTGQGCPTAPRPHVVSIEANLPGARGATRDNLWHAMHGEAFAAVRYRMFAAHARQTGQPALARLFDGLSTIELTEHFPALANLAGLVGDVTDNLTTSIAIENHETTTMYPSYAATARSAGDLEVADRFTEVGQDEAEHRNAFAAALCRHLQGRSPHCATTS